MMVGIVSKENCFFWDIKRDKGYSHIRENREVTTCKFSGDGGNLFFVLRPTCEEDDEGNSLEDTFFTYETHSYFDSLFIESINETTMKDAGIAEPYIVQESKVINETLYQLAAEQGLTYENRLHVWDVCMLNESELFATSNINCIEKWSIDGELISAVPDKENSKAIEIISPVENDCCLVNIEQRDADNPIDKNSVLYKWDIKSDEFSELIKMDFPASISTNTNGDMLVREVFRFSRDKENTLDFVIDRDYNRSLSLNLGYYETLNHYLRVNGADRFYFIQGTPASSHEQKWICSLDNTNKEYSRLFPMEWDSERNSHMFSDGGCYCKDSEGEALIIALRFYSPNPSGLAKDCATIVRRNLPDGKVLWNRSFDSQITSMLWLEEHSLIAVALTEGRICILSSVDGKLVLFEDVKIHGVDNVIMSMSYYHNHLVVGTVDGRIICYRLMSN